jgi:hypothetical protein
MTTPMKFKPCQGCGYSCPDNTRFQGKLAKHILMLSRAAKSARPASTQRKIFHKIKLHL